VKGDGNKYKVRGRETPEGRKLTEGAIRNAKDFNKEEEVAGFGDSGSIFRLGDGGHSKVE